MVCQVFYKFKSTTSFARVQFDGHWISVGELKTLIAEQKVGTELSSLLGSFMPPNIAPLTHWALNPAAF